MKKISLVLALALSTQVLFTGCSALNKQTSNSTQQTAQTQTQTDSSKADQATEESDDAAAKDSSTNSTASDSSKTKSSSTQNSTSKAQTTSSTSSATSISKEDVLSYSTMTKTNLIKTLGKDYKVQDNALVFSNGLSFYGLATNESKPTSIKCDDDTKIMGIKNGMTFNQVQAVLGKTQVIKTYLGTKTNIVYKVQYTYGKDILKVISSTDDGKDSYIQIVMQ